MKYVFSLILLLCSAVTFAQNADEQLAAQYYATGDFEKAILLYEKLLKKDPSSPYIYGNYLNSLLAVKEFEEAEKVVKRQAKKFPDNYMYAVDLGYVYEKSGNPEKATKEYEITIKSLSGTGDPQAMASAFLRRELPQYAVQTYLKARKLAGENKLFTAQLSALYAQSGRMDAFITESLNVLEEDTYALQQVQNNLQLQLSKPEEWLLLRKEISTRVQKNPDMEIYSEMMLWVLVQQKDFYAAYIQFKALDKRRKEGGKRLMELAAICTSNEDFDNAVKCYEYVVSLGEGGSNPYYTPARFGLLDVRYRRIVEYGRYTPQDLVDAEKDYLAFINTYGKDLVPEAARQLAILYNFYLDKPQQAMELLQSLVDEPRISPEFRASCKLELGDAYLVSGDVWEAELLYAQVDKDFKEDQLGREAKFRMARLFYFKGEFERARAYLDVLKTATTQLTSNNAIQLSLLILDNTGLDSTEEAMRIYADAELLIYRNKISEGLARLDEINVRFPSHALADEILFAKAQAMVKAKEYEKAAAYYAEIVSKYGTDILADNALFSLGDLYEKQLNDKEKAKAYYEELLLKHSGSLFTVEARKRYRKLRGDSNETVPKQQLFDDRLNN